MIPQISAILGSVPMILMIMAIKVLLTLHRISCHLIHPPEERLVFNLLQDLLYWLSKYNINRLGVGKSRLPNKIFLRSVVLDPIRSDLKSLLSWGTTFAFPFPCNWFFSILLYLSIRSINWRTLTIGLPVRDFLKSCSAGRLALKVPMATSS